VLVLLLAGCVPVSPSSARTASGPGRFPGTLAAEQHRFEIGRSAGGLPIEAYRFGRGPIRLILVGGIHGGYEWNTILLAYAVIDHYHTPFRTSFASYRVTGDATDWLSLQGIPAIDVELYNHDDIDMAQNLDGVEAVLSYLGTAR